MNDKPNIVFFMLDQLSAKWLDLARERQICPTPNIDRLQQHGTTFTRAFTSNPVCCPARATLATGMTTRQHGVLQNGYYLDPNIVTFMRLLQQNGWHTGCLGKLHLHSHFAGVYPDYKPYGFDVTHITEDPRAGEWVDWVEAAHPEHYEAVLSTIWAGDIPELEACGPDKINLRERIARARRNLDLSSPEVPHGDGSHYALPFPEEVSQTAWITMHALDFIRNAPASQPLYAHISYVQPHAPWCAPNACFDNVDVDAIPAPIAAEWIADPLCPDAFAGCGSGHLVKEVPEHWREMRHCYFADIHHLDRQLGRVMDALDEAGRLDNTYLIFLADHGELLLDHGFRGKECRHYEAAVRIPLIISGPGLEQGAACDAFVQLEDLAPTVLDLAGVPAPEQPVGPYAKQGRPPCFYGRSLAPLCRGEADPAPRDYAYIESYNSLWDHVPTNWNRTIRTAQYRYTWFTQGHGEQLFDIVDDPDETINLAGNPAYAAVRQQLRDRLLDAVILQDYPHTPRSLFMHAVH